LSYRLAEKAIPASRLRVLHFEWLLAGNARRFKFNQSMVRFGLIDRPITVMRLPKRLE
jgi:hypothetical protein